MQALVEEENAAVVVDEPNLAETHLAKIGKVARIIKGLRRDPVFLWGQNGATFYRVNYRDSAKSNEIVLSVFVKVTPDGAEVVK